jgi:predicted transcriptional regulator
MTTAPENRLNLQAITATDLMSKCRESLSHRATFREAVAYFVDRHITVALVAGEDGKPIGVISLTDLLIHVRECLATERIQPVAVSTLMTPTIFTVPADLPAEDVVQDMLRSKVHHLFVEKGGRIVGVINACDLLRHLRIGD